MFEDPAGETVDTERGDDAAEEEDEGSCGSEEFGDEGFGDGVDEEETFDLRCVTGSEDAGIQTADTVRYEDPACCGLFGDVCFGKGGGKGVYCGSGRHRGRCIVGESVSVKLEWLKKRWFTLDDPSNSIDR